MSELTAEQQEIVRLRKSVERLRCKTTRLVDRCRWLHLNNQVLKLKLENLKLEKGIK